MALNAVRGTTNGQIDLEANKELVRELVETLDKQQMDRLRDQYADDFTAEMFQDEGDTEEGDVEDLVDGHETFYEGFPDTSVELKEMAAEGDWVLYRFEVEATHEGEYKGIEPTGREVSFQVHHSRRIEEGEIVEAHSTATLLHVLSQLDVDLPIETED